MQKSTHILGSLLLPPLIATNRKVEQMFLFAVLTKRPFTDNPYGLSTCFLFRLIWSAFSCICFAVWCSVCLPAVSGVIVVSVHLLTQFSESLNDFVVVFLLFSLVHLHRITLNTLFTFSRWLNSTPFFSRNRPSGAPLLHGVLTLHFYIFISTCILLRTVTTLMYLHTCLHMKMNALFGIMVVG